MALIRLVDFKSLSDERGTLVALESSRNIAFEIRRVYYMVGMGSDVSRGFHAHKQLQQVAVCLAGRCRVVLDDGLQRGDVWLDSPTKGLLIGNLVWREMHDFSNDCVLMVLASEYYDEADYIRDFDLFREMVSNA